MKMTLRGAFCRDWAQVPGARVKWQRGGETLMGWSYVYNIEERALLCRSSLCYLPEQSGWWGGLVSAQTQMRLNSSGRPVDGRLRHRRVSDG